MIVPGLAGHGRSEALVLKKTVEFMVDRLMERRALVRECEEKGIDVEDYLRECAFLPLSHLSDFPLSVLLRVHPSSTHILTIRLQRFTSTRNLGGIPEEQGGRVR